MADGGFQDSWAKGLGWGDWWVGHCPGRGHSARALPRAHLPKAPRTLPVPSQPTEGRVLDADACLLGYPVEGGGVGVILALQRLPQSWVTQFPCAALPPRMGGVCDDGNCVWSPNLPSGGVS